MNADRAVTFFNDLWSPSILLKPIIKRQGVQSVARPVMYITFIGLTGKYLWLIRDIKVA
jgi:hypothetical protein